jgi:predicted RND superfamily exporter protein
MTSRLLRLVSWLTLKHSWLLLIVIAVFTAVLYFNIRNLKMGTNLTDLFGDNTPELRAANEYVQHSGYGNQLFLVIETTGSAEDASEPMETLASRITVAMNQSGRFKYARCGLSEQELLGMVRLFAWNFPSYLHPGQVEALKARLSPAGIKATVGRAGADLVTPFSWLGTNYFLTDPLGLMELSAPAGQGLGSFFNFDLEWGSGNYFFSKDHKALLVVAEPRRPAMDYKSAGEVVAWTRGLTRSLLAEEQFKQPPLRVTMTGGYVFAEQDHNFIEKNISLVSLVSIIGNLILCLLVYRRIPLLLMSFIPTSLGLLWATGLIAWYPGHVNLISLSFIAILVGLGDDQVVYFMNRVPQEWTGGKTLDEAMTHTIATTGKSIIFCILTAGTATVALMTSGFKALSEFGLVLTIGLLMLLLHTLLTIPALMRLWWTRFPPRVSKRVTFRFLPAISQPLADLLSAHPRVILAGSVAVFVASLATFPSLKMSRKVEMTRGGEHPAVIGQERLAEKFGIEGTPELLLLEGTEEDVLRRTEGLASELEALKKQGRLRSIFSPSQIVPSHRAQLEGAHLVQQLDLPAAAGNLTRSLKESGFNVAYFEPAINRLRELGGGSPKPLSLAEASAYLPRGILDNSIERLGANRCLAAVAVYATDPDLIDAIPAATIRSLQRKYGPFTDFSYAKINRDLQLQIFRDSRHALLLTAIGIALIVFLCFRDVPMTALVLMPIGFAIVVTFGILVLFRHPFSYMALTAFPLIIGIGIDNGIHLARRYLEGSARDVAGVLRLAGAPLLQSNLTTIIGFGALMVSQFAPLAELGLVTALGVAMTLVGSFWVLPAVLIVFRIRRDGAPVPALAAGDDD